MRKLTETNGLAWRWGFEAGDARIRGLHLRRAHDRGARTAGLREERKAFFSEEKKQKTCIPPLAPRGMANAGTIRERRR